MDQDTPKVQDFESSLAELESIVKRLEAGNLSLETSLELFERGIELSKYCHTRLEAAERRVEVLTQRGDVTEAPTQLLETSEAPEE